MRAHSAVHQVTRGVTGAKKFWGTGRALTLVDDHITNQAE
jgi:hypothetical protein